MKLHFFVLAGLGLWAIPAILVVGPTTVAPALLVAAPVWLDARASARKRPPVIASPETRVSAGTVAALVAFCCVYLLVDAALGRQKLAQNLFVTRGAVDYAMEGVNETVSQGRGVAELLGGLLVFYPFALWDLARRTPGRAARVLKAAAVLFLFYEVGVSRGFALVSVATIIISRGVGVRRLLWAGGTAMAVFVTASMFRGDYGEVTWNPLVDAAVWPVINLVMMLGSNCGEASSFAFVAEIAKKFLPAFLVQKEVFSFNVEMTRCINPHMSDYVDSVSIFTYMGEFLYYKPTLLTAAIAGIVLAVLCHYSDALLTRARLPSVRIYTGLMCIVALRSRVLDVVSLLMFVILFAFVWRRVAVLDELAPALLVPNAGADEPPPVSISSAEPVIR